MNREHKFPKGLEIAAPQGKELAKFHNNIAFISLAKGEEVVNKAGFTPSQVDELQALEVARVQGKLEYRPLHFFPITIVDFAQQ